MAFQQALSGLNTSSKAIDATSHNIANSSTVGYKQSVAHFSDVYAASLNGSGANQIGIGATLSAIQQQFTQGNITSTNNPLDISINGAGFFRMDTNGAVTYTRNGQFHLDKNGYVVNDQQMKLTGYAALNGVIVPSTPQAIQISASDLAPKATGSNTTSTFQGVKANLNLDSRLTPPNPAWANGLPASVPPAQTNLWTVDPTTYNYSTAVSVYDTLGNAHNLTMYFRKAQDTGDWAVFASLDGTTNDHITITAAGVPALASVNVGTAATPVMVPGLQFSSIGSLDNATNPKLSLSIDIDGVMNDRGMPNNADANLTFDLDFTGTTQFGSAVGTNSMAQDGYTAGHLVGLSVGNDGVIQGRYSNGQTFAQGQVVLANFTNPNGLTSLGNNQWAETSMSGPSLVGSPNTSSLGVLTSSTVEESNVDLTAELVNLITEQRNYQANAQSIKTQDAVMQTLVNLR